MWRKSKADMHIKCKCCQQQHSILFRFSVLINIYIAHYGHYSELFLYIAEHVIGMHMITSYVGRRSHVSNYMCHVYLMHVYSLHNTCDKMYQGLPGRYGNSVMCRKISNSLYKVNFTCVNWLEYINTKYWRWLNKWRIYTKWLEEICVQVRRPIDNFVATIYMVQMYCQHSACPPKRFPDCAWWRCIDTTCIYTYTRHQELLSLPSFVCRVSIFSLYLIRI